MAFAGYGPDFTCNTNSGGDSYSYTTLAAASNSSAGSSLGVTSPSHVIASLANQTLNACSVNGSSCSSYVFSGVKRTIVTEVTGTGSSMT